MRIDEVTLDESFAAAWNRAADPFAPPAGIHHLTSAGIEVEQLFSRPR